MERVSFGFGYPGCVYSPYWNPHAYHPYPAPVYYPPFYGYTAPPLPYLYYYNLNGYYGLNRFYRPLPYYRITRPLRGREFPRMPPLGYYVPRRHVRR